METFKELFETAEVSAVFLIPIIAGVVEALKTATNLDKKYVPLISLLIGSMGSCLIALGFNTPLSNATLIGVVAGLGASGLYENIKKAAGK